MPDLDSVTRSLLEAASFAARAHRTQLRKDGQTPYASHPFRVALIVRHVFGIDDPTVLTVALLHDTIEDTTTDFDDLDARFGGQVADWVARLSKDKRLQDEPREEAYRADAGRRAVAGEGVQARRRVRQPDRQQAPVPRPAATNRRPARAYLQALDAPDLPPAARRAFQAASGLLAEFAE